MEELIRKSDARKAVLKAAPSAAYCISKLKPVEAREVVHGVWLDAGKNIHGQNLTQCSVCKANAIEGGWFCRCCGAEMKQ